MADMDDSLVTRRLRRTTAGNRMEAALAEMALDDLSKEPEDDIDFINDKDEEDVFDKDFESTDDEAQEDVNMGDKAVQDDEKREKKAARNRVAKSTAQAHARNKVTFNPQTFSSPKTLQTQPKAKRQVSLGVAINAETGKVIEGSSSANKRQSQRKHTVLNTSETVIRMKRSQAKRAAAGPKKVKSESRLRTQAELIARALDNEEGNIVEHRDYLKLEEEKRKRARVVRATVNGPLLRWVSRAEEITVKVDPPVPPSTMGYTYAYGSTPAHGVSGGSLFATTGNHLAYHPSASVLAGNATQASTVCAKSAAAPAQAKPHQSTPYHPTQGSPAQPTTRTEKVASNYVIHELGQYETVQKPPWNETMKAMFGDRPWEELRVFVGRSRPLARPKQICPITGRPARYLDPRTGVPYADLSAFRTLTSILAHEYVWSDALGCYVVHEKTENARGVRAAERGRDGHEGGAEAAGDKSVSMDVG